MDVAYLKKKKKKNLTQGFCDDLMRELAGKTMTRGAGNLGPQLDPASTVSLSQNAPLGLGFPIFKMNGLPRWLSGKESACTVRDVGSIPGSRRSPGEGNGNPLQYSYLGNPVDRGARRATVHRVT